LKNAHIVWDDATLDKWLTDTDAMIPGNDMAFHGRARRDRQVSARNVGEIASFRNENGSADSGENGVPSQHFKGSGYRDQG
jgi:hypothetical protein